MTTLVEDRDRGWKRIKREMALQARTDLVIDIGVVGAEADTPRPDSDLTNADIAMFHEYGTKGINLGRSGAEYGGCPERSFLRATVDEKSPLIMRLFERVTKGVIDGKINLKRGLVLIGERAVAWVKARIRSGIPPPLMPATIERKGSSKQLIDSSDLIGSITHIVRGAEKRAA